MNIKHIAFLTIFLSLMPLAVNAQKVFIKNIYTTPTGTPKSVIISLNNDSKEIPFNTTVNLGELKNINKLTIRTAMTAPVDIKKLIPDLEMEAIVKKSDALIAVYPSSPLNLGAWNIQYKWIDRPQNESHTIITQQQFEHFTRTGGFLERLEMIDTFLGTGYKQKINSIRNYKQLPNLFTYISTYMDKKDINIKELQVLIDHAIYSIDAHKRGIE